MAKNSLIFFFLFPLFIHAQTDVVTGLQLPVKGVLVRSTIYEGDTIPFVTLTPVICYADRVFKNKKQKDAWDRLKYNVKKVYPYAIIAAARLKEYDQLLSQFSNENEKKKYMKRAEKQLKEEFGGELKQLTMSQGRILIKLIDRETGQTSYDVVKSMRGSFSAFMWQGLALMFNSNLKDDYDAEGEDIAIERAIKMIEGGEL